MNWGVIAAWTGVLAGIVAANAATMRWLLDRRDERRNRDESRVEQIEKTFYDFKANLPIEYVRREDWIRFSATLDAKMDGLREEMREEIGPIKKKLYA